MSGPPRANAFDAAINLAAGFRLFVDDDGAQSGARRSRRRGKPGGTCADNGEIKRAGHTLNRGLPAWRSMRMPSATGTRQAC